jgi:isopropylmalate/homocitrate/citramalate synthase
MLKNAETYEIMRPEDVGVKATSLVMGKHSGRHAFRDKLKELGFELGDNALQDAFRRFKDLADRKKHVYDEDIEALVEDAAGETDPTSASMFKRLRVVCRDRRPPVRRDRSSSSMAKTSSPSPMATARSMRSSTRSSSLIAYRDA